MGKDKQMDDAKKMKRPKVFKREELPPRRDRKWDESVATQYGKAKQTGGAESRPGRQDGASSPKTFPVRRPPAAGRRGKRGFTKKEPPKRKAPESPQVLYSLGIGKRKLQVVLQQLVDNGIEMVVDVRGSANVTLPGFKQGRDMAILLKELAGIEYRREELLLPSREMLVQYGRDKNWPRFEAAYFELLTARRVEEELSMEQYGSMRTCLLGDEESEEHDYRRPAAEYLQARWRIVQVVYL
jgi:hypothetical protein